MADRTADPKAIVREGYDRVSGAYRADSAPEEPYRSWLRPIDGALPAGAPVLDLGCGCGVPAARILAERYQVTGVDLSPVQIDRARELVPAARFLCADMTAVEFAPASFAAIVSLYAIIHVPLDEQPALLDRIATWLRPGGLLLISVGGSDAWTGSEPDWLGVPGGTMYWSHADAATYRRWIEERGLQIERETFVPEGDGGHVLIHARAASWPLLDEGPG
jgi:SAM-dependent methyltransferase